MGFHRKLLRTYVSFNIIIDNNGITDFLERIGCFINIANLNISNKTGTYAMNIRSRNTS